ATVDDVQKTIDDVLNPPGDDGGGGGGGGDGGGGGGGPGHDPGTGGGGRSGPPADRSQLPATAPAGSGGAPTLVPPAPKGGRTTPASNPGVFERIGRAGIEAAKDLGFPLLLAAMVAAFLLIQNRLDRRDPKLALAPIVPDVARFE